MQYFDTVFFTINGHFHFFQATYPGKAYVRDYVIDYTSFENNDLTVFAEGNGQSDMFKEVGHVLCVKAEFLLIFYRDFLRFFCF